MASLRALKYKLWEMIFENKVEYTQVLVICENFVIATFLLKICLELRIHILQKYSHRILIIVQHCTPDVVWMLPAVLWAGTVHRSTQLCTAMCNCATQSWRGINNSRHVITHSVACLHVFRNLFLRNARENGALFFLRCENVVW